MRLDGSELYFVVNSTSAHFLNSGTTAQNAFAFSPWRGVAAIFMRDLYRLCLDVGGDDYGEGEREREREMERERDQGQRMHHVNEDRVSERASEPTPNR